MLHLTGGETLARQQYTAQTLDPEVYHLIGSALLVLIRSDLIAQGAEHIAVEHAGDGPAGQRQSHLKPLSFSRPEKFRLATGMFGYPALTSALRSRWM